MKRYHIDELLVEYLPLDDEIFNTINGQEDKQCSIALVVERCGKIAAIRCGVLTAQGKLRAVAGGGKDPYILTIVE